MNPNPSMGGMESSGMGMRQSIGQPQMHPKGYNEPGYGNPGHMHIPYNNPGPLGNQGYQPSGNYYPGSNMGGSMPSPYKPGGMGYNQSSGGPELNPNMNPGYFRQGGGARPEPPIEQEMMRKYGPGGFDQGNKYYPGYYEPLHGNPSMEGGMNKGFGPNRTPMRDHGYDEG